MKLKKSGIQAHKTAMKILNDFFDMQVLINLLITKLGGVIVLDKQWAREVQHNTSQKLYASWDKEGGLTLWLDKSYE
jgi:hypothetical protein